MKNFSLKNLFTRKHIETRVHPARDWYLMVTICLVLLVAGVIWNVWVFFQIANGKSLQAITKQTGATALHTVTNVQNVFKSRAAERANYENTYTFVDPS